jgi:hypothetical protein
MNTSELIAARRKAEESVADMQDGPLKEKAFEVILGSLLSAGSLRSSAKAEEETSERRVPGAPKSATTLVDRIALLADEGFFGEPRGLSELQAKLAEHGWHYPQQNLSTPLIRLVRKRALRRLQASEGGKKVWKYSLP